MLHRSTTLIVAFALGGGSLGCGDDQQPATHDDAGSHRTEADASSGSQHDDAGSHYADADASSASDCLPTCFLDQVRACLPDGACTFSMNGDDRAECYANGVKICRRPVPPSSTVPGTEVTVTRQDGVSPCFTVESMSPDGMSGTSAKYKTPSGDELASVGLPAGCDTHAQLSCGSESAAHDIDRCAPGCKLDATGVFAGECKPGSCSCP